MRSLVLALTLVAGATSAIAQRKPLFPGAEHLDSCLVDLPLTYAKKDRERYVQAARFLGGQEFICIVRDKKSRQENYTRVDVLAETGQDGSTFGYVGNAAQRLRMDDLVDLLRGVPTDHRALLQGHVL